MQHIGITLLLGRMQKLLSSEFALRESVQKSIFEVTGITLPKESVVLQGLTIRIKTSPLHRHEFLLKKKEILEHFQNTQSGLKVYDIK